MHSWYLLELDMLLLEVATLFTCRLSCCSVVPYHNVNGSDTPLTSM